MKIKNYKNLVPLVLIVLIAVSWYSLFNQSNAKAIAYNKYLTEARKDASQGITKYAMENYLKALEIKDDIDVNVEISNYLKDNSNSNDYVSWCKTVFEKHPTNEKAYDCILTAYYSTKDYESCYEIIHTAEKRNVSTDYLKKIDGLIAYEYKTDFYTYDDVSIYNNNFSAVKSKNLWGFVDRFGNLRVPCRYKSVGIFTQSAFAPVVDKDNNAFFIDKSGAKVMATNEVNYTSLGNYVDNMFTATLDGKTTFLNSDFKKMLGEYEYATTMNSGVAAIKSGDTWSLINSSGKQITSDTYANVIRDEKDIVNRNGRIFVKKNDLYSMIDETGKTVADNKYEDARPFMSEQPAAIKINGKWGFIDNNGNVKVQPQFDDARSFVNGIAAVKSNGKWGFIDESGKIVIEAEFFDAKDFNEKGSCFVNVGDKWQLIKLYRLNIEG